MLTITMQVEQKQLDIMVLPQQRILEVLKVLRENGLFIMKIEDKSIYSRRRKEYINQNLTFQQASIFNGDILEVREPGI